MTLYQWLLAMLREINRKHRPDKLDQVQQLMTEHEGRWPKLYKAVCKKYSLEVVPPPDRLISSTPSGILAINDLKHPTSAQ
eukprot:11869701-Heterocapsa_arctica.AAC.1